MVFSLIHEHEKSAELILEPATGSFMHDDCDDRGMLSDIALCLGG